MILRYHGGDANLEYLKEISGTNSRGTSFLGLMQASHKIGLSAEAYEAEIDELKKITEPAILYVELENGLQHYIVFFLYHKDNFIVGDPSEGIKKISKTQIVKIWRTGYLLKIEARKVKQVKKNYQFQQYRWLLHKMKEDESYYISGLFLGILLAILNMSTVVFSEKLIDVVFPSKDLDLLFKALAFWFFLMFLSSISNYSRSKLLLTQSYRFNVRIFNFFIERLIKMPKTFFDSKRKGDMIARLNDTERIEQNIKAIILDSSIEFLLIVAAISLIFVYSIQVGLIILLSFPALFLITASFNKKIKELRRKAYSENAKLESIYFDNISGIDTIKIHNQEEKFIGNITSVYKVFQSSLFNLFKKEISQELQIEVVGLIVVFCSLVYASLLAFENHIQVGDLIAVISLSFICWDSSKSLSKLNFEVLESKIAIERMFDFARKKPSVFQENKNNLESSININSIIFRNLSFSYPGQKILVDDFNLKIKLGELNYLTGPSGSGKSTIIKILLKFYQTYSGEIIINEKLNFGNINTKSWRGLISYVPQDIKIFNDSLGYNISMDENVSNSNLFDFSNEYNLLSMFLERFPESFNTILGEEGIHPSGGEKQLIGLFRALYDIPKILILDEPTSSLDKKTEDAVLDLLNSMKERILIFLVSHNQDILSTSDNMLVLRS